MKLIPGFRAGTERHDELGLASIRVPLDGGFHAARDQLSVTGFRGEIADGDFQFHRLLRNVGKRLHVGQPDLRGGAQFDAAGDAVPGGAERVGDCMGIWQVAVVLPVADDHPVVEADGQAVFAWL